MAQNKKKAKPAKKSAAKPAKKKAAPTKKTAVKKAKPVAKVAAAKKTAAKKAATGKPVAAKAVGKITTKTTTLNLSLVPLQDRVLVMVEGPSETTAGGIIIPGNAAARPNRGKVLATGGGKRNKKGALRPLDVSVGDVVLYPEYSGTPITLNGEEYLILREEELLGITK